MKKFKPTASFSQRIAAYERSRAWLIAVARGRILPRSARQLAEYVESYQKATHPCTPFSDDRLNWQIREIDGLEKFAKRLELLWEFLCAREAVWAWRASGYSLDLTRGMFLYAYYSHDGRLNDLLTAAERTKIDFIIDVEFEIADREYYEYKEEERRQWRRDNPKLAAQEDAEIAAAMSEPWIY